MLMSIEREIEAHHRQALRTFSSNGGLTVREIEAALFERIEGGDKGAIAELFVRQDKNVYAVCRRFADPGTVLYEDMQARSIYGLEKALARYNRHLERHQTFSSWCRNFIKDECLFIIRRVGKDEYITPLLESTLTTADAPKKDLPDFSLAFPHLEADKVNEVVEMIADGFTCSAIAERTGIGPGPQLSIRNKLREYYS